MPATSSNRLKTSGKQVLLDDQHFCDAKDEVAALAIVHALDYAGVGFTEVPVEASKAILRALL